MPYSYFILRNIHHDYTLASTLQGTEPLEECRYTYDVICNCLLNIIPHFQNHYPELVPIIEELQCLFPNMHIHAHKELCQITYALAYTARFGLTYGEGIKTPWAKFNIASLMT